MGPKDQSQDLPPALKALSDPTRLKIMLMLEGHPRTVGEVGEFFQLSQPTITRHLQQLARAGLVQRTKKAQRVYYEVNPDKVRCLCVDLVESFPCCCVDVKVIHLESKDKERKPSRRSKGVRTPAGGTKRRQSRSRRKPKTDKPKGRSR